MRQLHPTPNPVRSETLGLWKRVGWGRVRRSKSVSEHRWRDLGTRAISGVILGVIGLVAIDLGGAVWAAVVLLFGAGMLAEWATLSRWRPGPMLLGVLYVVPAIAALLWLHRGGSGLNRVLFLAAVVWAGDVGAYLVGRLAGGPRLAPRISPGKTWSGAVGGTFCAILAASLVIPGHAPEALLLSVVAQAGDLLESAIKRYFGVKDSGWLIPGHGGLLDRLDGVLTAAPAAALLVIGHRL